MWNLRVDLHAIDDVGMPVPHPSKYRTRHWLISTQAIVDIPMIEKYVRDGRFVFKRHHGRCATATEMEWPRDVCPAMLLPRYSEENYRILERYMRAHAYTAAKSAHVVRRR